MIPPEGFVFSCPRGQSFSSKDSHFFFTSCAAPRYNQPIDSKINLPYPAFISGEIMIFVKRFFLLLAVFYLLLLIPSFSGPACAQGITPAQEQELADAKVALGAARKAKAEKYAPETLKQAQDLCATAENARQSQDGVKFTQASRLARAYAELAKTMAEIKSEEEKLAATQEELEKARAEVDRLKKSQ
jgi:hypothetical protein